MARMFFHPPMVAPMGNRTSMQSNLHIVNDKGEVLSLAGDNSCGAFDVLSRLDLSHFTESTGNRVSGTETTYEASPVRFLEVLAKHLGYKVTKIVPGKCDECGGEEEKHYLSCSVWARAFVQAHPNHPKLPDHPNL